MVWAAALVLSLGGAQVDYTESGNGLYEACQARTGDFAFAICLGFIDGVNKAARDIDQVQKLNLYCPPSGVTKGQMKDVVVKYLRDHPEDRAYSASSMVMMAFMTAWPCKKS